MYCEELVQLLVKHEQCVVIICCCLHHNKRKPKTMSSDNHCTIKHIRKEFTITQKTTTKKQNTKPNRKTKVKITRNQIKYKNQKPKPHTHIKPNITHETKKIN
jgi:hypothetical protein